MSFLNSVLNNSKKYDDPFIHWELNKPLTDEQINEIINAEIANPEFSGSISESGKPNALDISLCVRCLLNGPKIGLCVEHIETILGT